MHPAVRWNAPLVLEVILVNSMPRSIEKHNLVLLFFTSNARLHANYVLLRCPQHSLYLEVGVPDPEGLGNTLPSRRCASPDSAAL